MELLWELVSPKPSLHMVEKRHSTTFILSPGNVNYQQAPYPYQQQQILYPTAPPTAHMTPVTYGTIESTTITVAPVGAGHATADKIIIVGGCPSCRIGVLEDDFTCCGVCCAIFCFPVGLLFCYLMRNKRCMTCGAQF